MIARRIFVQRYPVYADMRGRRFLIVDE